MKEKLLTPINHQLFIINYMGATDHKPTRFKITDTRFKVSEIFSYDDSFQTCDHNARDILESRGFTLAGYANDNTRSYFFTRDFRALNEPAPTPEPTPAPDSFLNNAVQFDAFFHGLDKNGNSLIKIKPHAEQYRAFSGQRLSIAPKLRQGTKGEQVRDPHALLSILAHYANNGTDTQKQALKIPVFEYHTESRYDGKEWELSSVDDTMTAARATLKDYRANQPQYTHRITKRRIGA